MVNIVKDKAEKSGYTIPLSMTAEPGQLPMDDVLQGILLLMGALGVLSLFLSVFLVVNTVSALLAQQKRQIAVMKAIGGGSLQILGMYLVMVISYGILALLIAIPAGTVGARALSQLLATMFNFNLPAMQIPPQTILTQAVIGLVLPVLASLFPFLSSLRLSAAEAMSAHTIGKGRFGKNWIDLLALRVEPVVHPQAFHPPAPALGQKHLSQQGTAGAYLDHAHTGIRHLYQCLQCALFLDQHGGGHDQVVQLRCDADLRPLVSSDKVQHEALKCTGSRENRCMAATAGTPGAPGWQ